MAIAGAVIALVGLGVSANRASKQRRLLASQRKIDERSAELQASRQRKLEFASARRQRTRLLAREKAQGFRSSGTSGQVAAIGTQLSEVSSFANTVNAANNQRRSAFGRINDFVSRSATISAGFGLASNLAIALEPDPASQVPG